MSYQLNHSDHWYQEMNRLEREALLLEAQIERMLADSRKVKAEGNKAGNYWAKVVAFAAAALQSLKFTLG